MVTSSQVDEVHLQLADHFSPSVIRHRSVWTARHRTPSFVATLFNLGVLLGGIDRLNKYKPPGLSSYSFSFGAGPQCSPEDMGNGDAKDACEQLIQQVHFGTHDYDLQIERAGSFYYYAALTTVAAWLTLDLARWCGRSSAILDYLLGFHSAARERARYRAFLLLLLPYLHLLLLYCLPLTAGCCRATLNPAAVLERACPSMARWSALAAPQLGPCASSACASSGRAWRLWASLSGSTLPGGRDWPTWRPVPQPRVLESAASNASDPHHL